MKSLTIFAFILCLLIACQENKPIQEKAAPITDSIKKDSLTQVEKKDSVCCPSDSLDELAQFIAGKVVPQPKILTHYFQSPTFIKHAETFNHKWQQFDTNRIQVLQQFTKEKLSQLAPSPKTLFYPFSGPDILYANTFFPDADQYILIGLEPVGSLPIYDNKKILPDSQHIYFHKINTSLVAILNFSFFRTISMNVDLRNDLEDGTLHLLLLFLARTNNHIVSAKPVFIDSVGKINQMSDFVSLKKSHHLNKGVCIQFIGPKKEKIQNLYYFSLNLADIGINKNAGLQQYLNQLPEMYTYLKGASYLMHKISFQKIRQIIFQHSTSIIQDDSGIALKYFEKSGFKWEYTFFGAYRKPIPMFSAFYQKDLDSLYKTKGSTEIGFGIGYNFKDKNSNFMVAKKVQ